jgi:ubiquitin-conjugating enzyme E2 variant
MAYPLQKTTFETKQAAPVVVLPDPLAEAEMSLEEHAGPLHLAAEWVMVLTFPLVLGAVLYSAGSHLYEQGWFWLIALAVPVGLILGDFVSGIVHWGADSYFHYNTPFLGAAFIKPFRLHHAFPKDICTHNLVSVTGNTCILAVPIMALCLYILWRKFVPVWLAGGIFLTAIMSLATVLTNLFHKWAHLGEDAAPVVKWLQGKHLILPADHHQVHHTPPHKRYYCITNGWLNPLLDKIDFFPRLERALGRAGINTTIDNP